MATPTSAPPSNKLVLRKYLPVPLLNLAKRNGMNRDWAKKIRIPNRGRNARNEKAGAGLQSISHVIQ
jgi:hypothetical protein